MTDAEQIAELKRQVADLMRQNKALIEENARLRKALEEWKRGHRERSKRRSSRPEGKRNAECKRPGRKAGHAGAFRPVPTPDRRVEHRMPVHCTCGGDVQSSGETDRTIVQDIPRVRVENVEHVGHVGYCTRCHKRVVARLPGAVSGGRPISGVQVGPNAQALMLALRYECRAPLRGIGVMLGGWFGFQITAGGISQLIDRLRRRGAESYAEIEQRVRQSAVIGIDETGLRQGGLGGWTWLARTDTASLFRVELSRASWVAERMLGARFVGVVCSDFYGVYTAKTEWKHAYCGAHMIREAKKIAEVDPCLVTKRFCDEICTWYAEAKAAAGGSASARRRTKGRLVEIAAWRSWCGHPEVQRLCTRIVANFDGIVAFVDNPALPADNNASERDIRPIAVYRKITGGTRSRGGSESLAHWMSITQTLRKNRIPMRRYVVGLWDAHLNGRPPPSVFANH